MWENMGGTPNLQVQTIPTDKGGEFVNYDIDSWYQSHDIKHIKVGPKRMHMNTVERQHQSLGEMAKKMLRKVALLKTTVVMRLSMLFIRRTYFTTGLQGAQHLQAIQIEV